VRGKPRGGRREGRFQGCEAPYQSLSDWLAKSGANGTPAARRPLPAPGTGLGIPFPLVTINQAPVQYKGEDLEPERGPGLGCFRFQLIVLGIFIVLTPLSVAWGWPPMISAALLFAVILLLLFAGQTIIFLLRLVAADRRSRRRPLASGSKTVGELEDEASGEAARPASDDAPSPPADEGPVR
jgi:hypothetical protein